MIPFASRKPKLLRGILKKKRKEKKKALRQMTSTAWAPAVGAAGQRGEAELLQEVGIVHDLSANGPSRE